MKLSATLFAVAAMASNAMAMTISHKNVAKVLRSARRMEENAAEEQQEAEYDYLAKYNLKMIRCSAGTVVQDPETGEYEYSAVVVRLCPSESGCDSDSSSGCGAGYGDFVVGIQTFVDAYFEDQRDNMQWDDDTFQVDKYTECREYDVEAEADDDGEQAQYFVGPTCTAGGTDIALAVFDDEACTYPSETTFEEISNGWSLPYSEGGLISTSCIDCIEYNDDGAYELREMCQNLYQDAAYACETEMEYYSYYGQNTQGCDAITEIMPAAAAKNGGKVFGWIVFFLVVVGVCAYVMWWRKKKAAAADGLMS